MEDFTWYMNENIYSMMENNGIQRAHSDMEHAEVLCRTSRNSTREHKLKKLV